MRSKKSHTATFLLLYVCLTGASILSKHQRTDNAYAQTEQSSRAYDDTADHGEQLSSHGQDQLISGPGAMTITGPSSVKVGDTVTFRCFADCTPGCNISWSFQGERLVGEALPPAAFYQDLFTPASQLVVDVKLYNGLQPIECTAINPVSRQAQHTTKTLVVTDEIAVRSDDHPLPIADNSFSLQCTGGQQPSSIQWTVNFQPLPTSDRVFLADNGAALIFDHLQPGDSALYQCVVTEQNRVIPGIPYELFVIYGPQLAEITSPRVKSLGKHLRLDPGSSETLMCSADCYPKCSYIWTLNDMVVSTKNTFSISSAGVDDNGNLTCVVTSPVTKNTTMVWTNIEVIDGPSDVVILGPTSQQVGVKSTFECSAICTPPCVYTWEIYGQTLSGGKVELTLSHYEATETLVCKAINNVSGKTASTNKTIDVTDPDWCGC